MRTSTSKRLRGFTLVELLVVILLIGLGLGISLTVDVAGSPQQQKQQVLLLANALELAAQEAVLDDTVLGLDFFTGAGQALGYRWLQLRDAQWRPYRIEDVPAETRLPDALTATLTFGAGAVTPEPRVELDGLASFAPEILLLPTRELTPFTLSIAGDTGDASLLTADLMGRIRVDADAPPPPR